MNYLCHNLLGPFWGLSRRLAYRRPPTSEDVIIFDSNMKHHKDMLIKATIAGGGVIPHIHKSLLEKQRAQGESGPAAPAKSN